MDIDTLEALALADDRDAALATLVPGTDDHDYYLALRHQHRGELDAVDALIERWRRRGGRGERLDTIERRQRLLRVDRDPEGHVDALAPSTPLRHVPEVVQAAATHPTALSPDLISAEAAVSLALRRDRSAKFLTPAALGWVLANRSLEPLRRRSVLERLDRTGLPGLIAAIAADLADPASKGFGSLAVHRRLTADELDALAAARPALATDPAWVEQRIARLAPPTTVDLERDHAARRSYLDALWTWVEPLPPAFASLRAHVAYHRLALDHREGIVDRARLLAYLSIPRRVSYARSEWLDGFESARIAALEQAFPSITALPVVRDDEPLVRELLGALLLTDDGAGFAEVVDRRWLDHLLAETRLMAGDPAVERWTALLGPSEVAALRDRVEISFAPDRPTAFPRDASIALDVVVKNAWPLSVRVFRVDAEAVHRATGGEVSIGVDLDGAVPGTSFVVSSDAPPIRRTRHTVPIPGTDRPGTYVIEFVGNGRASRALVRKGDLRCAAAPTPTGVAVTVVDERGRHAPNAVIHFGGRTWAADSSGAVRLPFSTRPGPAPALVVDGDLAVPATIPLTAEAPELRARFLLDRQALQPGRAAQVVLRVELVRGGVPASVDRIESPYVEWVTVDRAGITARARRPLALADDRDATLDLAVPDHLASVTLAVGGKVRDESQQRTVDLRHEETLPVGTLHDSAEIEFLVLERARAGWRLGLIGKSGEPRPGRAVNLALTHRFCAVAVETVLATDDAGRIDLGPLDDVTEVRASVAGRGQRWWIGPGERWSDAERTVRAGDALRIPLPAGTPPEWSLVATGRFGPVRHHDDRVGAAPGGLAIAGLEPGRYELWTAAGTTAITVIPAAAPTARGWVTTANDVRPLTVPAPSLGRVEPEGDTLAISVADPGPRTRVHVVWLPLWPSPAFSADLATDPVADPRAVPIAPPDVRYVTGRDIGDEARYVLDRRSAPRRAGTMLDRPALLLNPYAVGATTTARVAPLGASGWAGAAAAPAPIAADSSRERFGGRGSDPVQAPFDWLDVPVTVAGGDLDEAGELRVAIPAGAALGWVVCVDPRATSSRPVPVGDAHPASRDRRLAEALPAGRHLRQRKAVIPLPVGAQRSSDSVLRIDPSTAQVARVDTVEVAYQALCAVGPPGGPLATWDFLPRWGALPREEKLRLYSEHACHELSLFVAFKDRPLFESAVRPYLANKLHPTFVDRWLLGEDLRGWLAPHRLARLNAFEKALLARAVPEARAALARQLADAVDAMPVDPARDERLVDVLLAGSSDGPEGGGGEVTLDLGDDEDDADGEMARSVVSRRAAPKAKKAGGPRGGGGGRAADEVDLMLDEEPTLFRGVERTQEWVEHGWWHAPGAGPEHLGAERLWRDLAAHGDGPFLSPALADAAGSFAAAVCALAVLELPFEPGGNALLAASELIEVAGPPAGTVLVGQSLVRLDDRWEWDGPDRREKVVGDELVAGVVYEARIVVSNPTGATQRVSVVVQIPAGTVPVSGAIPTRTVHLELDPYATTTVDVAFYAPLPGTFRWWGARVVRGDRLLAAAADRTLTVVWVPTTVDAASWPHVSQRGSLAEVVAFLRGCNLTRIDLPRIAWRMGEREAFDEVTAVLSERRWYDDTLWAYALVHRDRARLGEWLASRPELVDGLDPLDLGWIRLDAVDRGAYDHREYAPLVNARAHRLGATRVIPNDGLARQWRRFLERVARSPAPTPSDWLEAAQYLYVMDRPEDAMRAVARAPVDQVRSGLQHAYLSAYAAAVRGDLPGARAAIAPHLDAPVDRWRNRFRTVAATLDEVEGKAGSDADPDRRESRMDALASRQVTLRVVAHRDAIEIDVQHVSDVELRFHRMDVELLFSRQPFLSADVDRFTLVEPATIERHAIDGRLVVPVPAAVARADLVIEVRAGPARQVVTRYASDLTVAVAGAFGQLQVRRTSTGAAVPAAYVKAYARSVGGGVAFYKDGYTDWRGRFDYATLSTDDLDRVERFALLVLHDECGAVVLEAEPPRR